MSDFLLALGFFIVCLILVLAVVRISVFLIGEGLERVALIILFVVVVIMIASSVWIGEYK